MALTPTQEQFYSFQALFAYFNSALFEGGLPNVILNFSRKNQTAGFFAPDRWKRNEGEEKQHEISINPLSLSKGRDFVLQTLVHEMVHLWQEEKGTPGAKGYHNLEWANKMSSIGLIPSDTGEPGGKKIGFKMCDYLEEGGVLQNLIWNMPEDIWLPFQAIEYLSKEELQEMLVQAEAEEDQEAIIEIKEQLEQVETKAKKNKSKYTCSGCNANVWGKPGLELLCIKCDQEFKPVEMEELATLD